jgi:type I restriction enzyme S subunit
MIRLKYLTAVNPTLPRNRVPLPNDEVTFLPMERIGENGELDLSLVRPAKEISQGYTAVLDGDVVIAKITPCFENGKGALCAALQGGVGFGTTELIVLRAKQLSDPLFLYWLTRSYEFRNWGEAEMTGSAGQKRVTEEFVSNFRTANLATTQQCRIAAYLDEQAAKIDRLMEMRRRQMELLKEQRAALIQQTVTRGLNPDVSMKDSGIPWLGEIPAHWEAKRLKYLCSLLRDGTHQPPKRVEKGYPLLSVRNIVDGVFSNREDDSMISSADFDLLNRSFTVQTGDLLLAIVGATLGKVAIVPEMEPFQIQRSLSILRSRPSVVNREYLRYFIECQVFQKCIWSNVGFSAQPGIYLSTVGNLFCPLPSLDEQQEILDFILIQCSKIDSTISAYARQLTLLTEYRAALIHECVTGQREV